MPNLPNPEHKSPFQATCLWLILVAAVSALFLLLGGLFVGATVLPSAGAQGADFLRNLMGDQAVADLETIVYQSIDAVIKWQYQSGLLTAVAPWSSEKSTAASPTVLLSPVPTAKVSESATIIPTVLPPSSLKGAAHKSAGSQPAVTPTWSLPTVAPLGSLAGEGQWSIYLVNSDEQAVAYRTYLQPDPQRPNAVAAIVAFDLQATRLYFVLGTQEPASSVKLARPGVIPYEVMQSGNLLAAFNGGFKACNGHFGAMMNGIIVLPPRDGLGTVAMYTDGRAQIGAWDVDLTSTPDMVAWRQNGPLLIHNGQINTHTTSQDWGTSINGSVAVWRSGLGLSADGRTLYYVAGPSLTITSLTHTLIQIGAYQAMGLDINNGLVHFDAFRLDTNGLITPEPLLVKMQTNPKRFFKSYKRDFFYITANKG